MTIVGWHPLCDPRRFAMSRRSANLRASQDYLQSFHPVECVGRVRAHLRGIGKRWRRDLRGDDRCDAPQGSPDCGQSAQKGILSHYIGHKKGGLNFKLHAVCGYEGRPISLFFTAGKVIDYTGSATLMRTMHAAKVLMADKGCNAYWLHDDLADRKIEACIRSESNRKIQIPHDRWFYRKRHTIENLFGKLKGLRRIHTQDG